MQKCQYFEGARSGSKTFLNNSVTFERQEKSL